MPDTENIINFQSTDVLTLTDSNASQLILAHMGDLLEIKTSIYSHMNVTFNKPELKDLIEILTYHYANGSLPPSQEFLRAFMDNVVYSEGE